MNKVIISGKIVSELELKTTSSKNPYVRFSILSREYGYKNEFFNVIAWDNNANFITNYLSKGSYIVIEGRLANNLYEKNGIKVKNLEIIVTRVESLNDNNSTSGETQSTKVTNSYSKNQSINEDTAYTDYPLDKIEIDD